MTRLRARRVDGDTGPNPLPDEVVAEAIEQADIEGPLVDWKEKGHQVDLVGREAVGDREAYKVKHTLKNGAVRYEYIAVKTLYPVRGRAVRIEATFGDFKKTRGILFPHRVEVGAAGRPQRLRVVVDKIEVNPPLSDARFEMPAPAQP